MTNPNVDIHIRHNVNVYILHSTDIDILHDINVYILQEYVIYIKLQSKRVTKCPHKITKCSNLKALKV